jgi:1-deoxy-D-xylulose-5-phosphate synthase
MAAADEAELARMVATAAAIDDGPSALRYPRGEGVGAAMTGIGQPLEIGRGRIVREGTHVAILSYGATLARALAAADLLTEAGITVTVADARFAKPLDHDLVARLVREHALVVTLEEGAIGGFATQVTGYLAGPARTGIDGARLLTMHLPDQFIEHGSQGEQEVWAGLDPRSLAKSIAAAYGCQRRHRLLAAE